METKPKIDFNKTPQQIVEDLYKRLDVKNPFHQQNEIVACSILNMMLEKTLMYGGNDNNIPLNQKILRSYYEGIGRKSNRLPSIVEKCILGDKNALNELVDTVIDIAGYSIIALSSFAEEIQSE